MVVSLGIQVGDCVVTVSLVGAQECVSDSETGWSDLDVVHFDHSLLGLSERARHSHKQQVFVCVVLYSRREELCNFFGKEVSISGSIEQNWDEGDLCDSVVIEIHCRKLEESDVHTFLEMVKNEGVFDKVMIRDKCSSEENARKHTLLPELTPLQSIWIFVDDLSLLEVDVCISVDWRHLHEWLVNEGWMGDVLLQPEEPIDWISEQIRMPESVGYVRGSLLVWSWNVELVALVMVVVVIHRPLVDLLLPSLDVAWGESLPDVHFIADVSMLVAAFLVQSFVVIVDLIFVALERLCVVLDCRVNVGVDTRSSSEVRSVHFFDGVVQLLLKFEAVLKVINNVIVSLNLSFEEILFSRALDVIRTLRIPVAYVIWILFVLKEGVLLQFLESLSSLGSACQISRLLGRKCTVPVLSLSDF